MGGVPWLIVLMLQVAGGGVAADRVASGPSRGSLTPAPPDRLQTSEARQWRDRIDLKGHISILADALPRREATELRPQAGIETTARLSDAIRARFEGFAEALIADRDGRVTDAGVRVRDAWIEAAGKRADLRVGYGRVVWGRLDEIQPSDVINPLDTARFLFDGRASARLPVTFISSRLFLSETLNIQAVVVPRFSRGSFDQLDEPTSPFNLLRDVILPAGLTLSSGVIHHDEPRGVEALSGGARMSATAGRLDFSVAAYRGRDGFGPVSFEPDSLLTAPTPGMFVVGRLVERFPRFTMIAGDFETVRGDWALRGEAAVFVEKKLQTAQGTLVDGRVLDAGLGFDRRTGDYRVFGSVLVRREWSDDAPAVAKTNVSLVGSIEREFARERYLARVFAVVNPGDASAFVRGLLVSRLRDNTALELSAAAFAGTGDDTISRFRTRDFLLARVRVYW
jgi:hypothetical protein